jgi:hypothetical protein
LRPHISYSELQAFACECQWKWKLEYLEGHRSSEQSVHFDFGTAIHAALEAYYRRKAPISLEHAKVLFTKKFAWLFKKYGDKYKAPLSVKDYTGFIASGLNILDQFKEVINSGLYPELKGAEVVHNEFRLFEPIDRDDGIDIKFKGFIDIVLKTVDKRGKPLLYVCDFKTCSWGWDREKREDRWKQYQIFLYKHFLCKKFNIEPKSVRCAFFLLKKRPPKNASAIEFFPVSAGPVSVQRALDKLNENITEMTERAKDGSFKKDRSCCVNAYGRTCPFFKTPQCTEN